MAAQNQAAHASAITAAGVALIAAINAAKDDGLKVDLSLRIFVEPRGADVVPANVGRFELAEVFYSLGGTPS